MTLSSMPLQRWTCCARDPELLRCTGIATPVVLNGPAHAQHEIERV
jgi:hypothetical protein